MFGLPFQQTALWNTTWQWQYMRWKRKKMRKDFLSSWAVVWFKQQVQSGNLTSQWKSPSSIAMIGNTSTNGEFCMATLDYQRVVIFSQTLPETCCFQIGFFFTHGWGYILGGKNPSQHIIGASQLLGVSSIFRVIPKSQTFCCNPRGEIVAYTSYTGPLAFQICPDVWVRDIRKPSKPKVFGCLGIIEGDCVSTNCVTEQGHLR